MTTGSSSSRTTEYAISAVDLPAGETTTGTGVHAVRPGIAQAAAEDADVRHPAARSRVPRGPVPREPTLRERTFRVGDASRPAPHEPDHEPDHEPVPEPDDEHFFTDEDLFTDEELFADEPVGREPAGREPIGRESVGREPAGREGAVHETAVHETAVHETAVHETAVREAFGREPGAHGDPSRSYGDPVGDLVRAAVADRPLEEVVDLIAMLEQSPQYAQAT
ncbi:hypothetical protein GTW67_11200, partial [Streptomyces sp. SID5910]|nr:hypothetical protein [Streptomyces sp. SID5910]